MNENLKGREAPHHTANPTLSPPNSFFTEQHHSSKNSLVSGCSQLQPTEIPGLNCPDQPHLGPPPPSPRPHVAQQCHSCAGPQLPTALPRARYGLLPDGCLAWWPELSHPQLPCRACTAQVLWGQALLPKPYGAAAPSHLPV